MCKSDGEASAPRRFASMTRRHASTVASSPRSFAASRTAQAASEDLSDEGLSDVSLADVSLADLALSDLGSPEIIPRRSGAVVPNRIVFIANVPQAISRLNARDAEPGGSCLFQ